MAKVSIKGVARRARAADKAARGPNQAKTLDSFQNFAAGLGIGTDNLSSMSTYGFNPITRERTLLEWIHRGSWLGGVAVDLVGDDMTRAGIKLKGELQPDDIERINEEATRLAVWSAINDNVRWSRLYGGSIAVPLISGQKYETPFRVDTVGKGMFRGLVVFDRWMVEPSTEDLITEQGPDMGMPKYYRVTFDAPGLRGVKIHHSRCIRLEGVRLPYWQRVQENMWGESVYERIYDRMVAFDSATQGAAQLVYKAYIRTYNIKDMRKIVATGGPQLAGLIKYVDMMRRFQTIEGITLLDGDDKFEAHTQQSFSGLGDALVQFGQQLSGALQIPLVRLFGQSPAGLNSTGESDLRMYYDGIKQQQVKHLQVPMTMVYRAIARSLGIALPPGFSIEFNSLWQLTDKEKAEIASTITETVAKGVDAGLAKLSQGMEELRQSSEVTNIWSNIDEDSIEEAKEQEALAPDPMSLLGPDGQPLPPGVAAPGGAVPPATVPGALGGGNPPPVPAVPAQGTQPQPTRPPQGVPGPAAPKGKRA